MAHPSAITVEPADLSNRGFKALVESHVGFCDATSPEESCHRLEIDALTAPELTVWQAREDQKLLGMGALKALSAKDGEIKSMHTLAAARGKGVARALLDTILSEALSRGYRALWLESGSHPDFLPARQLYASFGFAETEPFGSYVADSHSVFMTKPLISWEVPA